MSRSPDRLKSALVAMLLLAGCGGGPASEGDDALTAAEDRRLDQAAERLDREREATEAEMVAQARADATAAEIDSPTPEAP